MAIRIEDNLGELWTLNFGPQHPATHTTFHLVLTLDGERIVGCDSHIGYLHSGFEKLGEDLDFNQYVTITDRMNYLSPICNNIAWHMTVEKLLGIEITRRCCYLRVIMNELSRISDHLLNIGTAALDLGGFTGFIYAFTPREMIYDIFELACGHRFTNSYTRVGGLVDDITPEIIEKIRILLKELPDAMNDVERLLTKNQIFIGRTKGIGIISKKQIIDWSITGPVARASDVRRDLRKDEPFMSYEEFDFKVPISGGCDCYARYLVRLEEIRQSMRIIEQAIENLPSGPVNVGPNEKIVLPPKDAVYGSIESLIHHFELIMPNKQFKPPIGEAYGCNESPNGELGFYIVSDGSARAYRARCRPPSFLNYQYFPKMIEGLQISDLVAVMGSLNIIVAELDR
jgi:NADH-quinone oxidoreductase subunit D